MARTGRPKGTGGTPQAMTKKSVWAARKMAMVYAEEAMDKLVEIMRDDDADRSVQRQAANDLLNRAFGTAPSYQIVEKTINDERQSPLSDAAISDADTAYLQNAMIALARFVEQEKNTLDVTPEMPDNYPQD